MSANIPSTMPMSDLLKSTGYNCPEELQGKTFDEATSGGDTKISTNTAATVDVSTYTEPVEIEPAEGYDATKKVTVSLSNIPAGANMLYAWKNVSDNSILYTSFDIAPEQASNEFYITIEMTDKSIILESIGQEQEYVKYSDTRIELGGETYTRASTEDVEVWNAPPSVETTKQVTIDVSTYNPANKPVITPTAGKQSMAEVEVTLSNIPSGGSATAYGWVNDADSEDIWYTNFAVAPETSANKKDVYFTEGSIIVGNFNVTGYERISDTKFSIDDSGTTVTYTRDSTKDFTLWS